MCCDRTGSTNAFSVSRSRLLGRGGRVGQLMMEEIKANQQEMEQKRQWISEEIQIQNVFICVWVYIYTYVCVCLLSTQGVSQVKTIATKPIAETSVVLQLIYTNTNKATHAHIIILHTFAHTYHTTTTTTTWSSGSSQAKSGEVLKMASFYELLAAGQSQLLEPNEGKHCVGMCAYTYVCVCVATVAQWRGSHL